MTKKGAVCAHKDSISAARTWGSSHSGVRPGDSPGPCTNTCWAPGPCPYAMPRCGQIRFWLVQHGGPAISWIGGTADLHATLNQVQAGGSRSVVSAVCKRVICNASSSPRPLSVPCPNLCQTHTVRKPDAVAMVWLDCQTKITANIASLFQ